MSDGISGRKEKGHLTRKTTLEVRGRVFKCPGKRRKRKIPRQVPSFQKKIKIGGGKACQWWRKWGQKEWGNVSPRVRKWLSQYLESEVSLFGVEYERGKAIESSPQDFLRSRNVPGALRRGTQGIITRKISVSVLSYG